MVLNFPIRWRQGLWLFLSLGLLGVGSLQGAVISYWRFEVDNDTSQYGLSSPNTVTGEPAMISTGARVDASANPGSLPNTVVPILGLPNTASLDGYRASGDPDINATAAYSPSLNVASMTAELWTRTEESVAVILARTTSPVQDSISNGFRIYDPQELKVQFVTSNNSGGNQITSLISTNYALDTDGVVNGSASWHHIAFTYDQATGQARLYADGVVIGSVSVAAGRRLYWTGSPVVTVGDRMDGNSFSKGTTDAGYIDEIRFSDQALPPGQMIVPPVPVPEPATYGVGVLLFGVVGWRVLGRKRLRGQVESVRA